MGSKHVHNVMLTSPDKMALLFHNGRRVMNTDNHKRHHAQKTQRTEALKFTDYICCGFHMTKMHLCATACVVVVPLWNDSDIVEYWNLHEHSLVCDNMRVCLWGLWVCVCVCAFAASTISPIESHSGTALIKRRSHRAIELPSKTF